MQSLPDELITNHVIPYLNIKSKYQFGLVCNKYYKFVEGDLQKEVKKLKKIAERRKAVLDVLHSMDKKLTYMLDKLQNVENKFAKNDR